MSIILMTSSSFKSLMIIGENIQLLIIPINLWKTNPLNNFVPKFEVFYNGEVILVISSFNGNLYFSLSIKVELSDQFIIEVYEYANILVMLT